jgi:hypothetical protein
MHRLFTGLKSLDLRGHIMSPARLQATLEVAAKLPCLKALHVEGNHAIGNEMLCQVGAHDWHTMPNHIMFLNCAVTSGCRSSP